MEKFDQLLTAINKLVCCIFFGAMLINVFGSVILRYIFNFSFRWSEELTRFLFIYVVFLGIPIAFREKLHVSIEYFTSKYFKKINRLLQVFCDILIGITITYIGYFTIVMIKSQIGRTASTGLKISMGYIYISVIICIILLLFEIIQRLTFKNNNS
jgi:C4-dicarboxylate transporter, DctQ subunit